MPTETYQIVIDSTGARAGASAATAAFGSVALAAQNSTRSITGMRASLTSLFGVLAGGAILGSSVRQWSQFSQTMANARSVIGATDLEFRQLRESVLELGRTTRATSQEAGDALAFLGRAGFSANEALAALPTTLALSQSTATDLARSADIMSNALQAFRLQASESARVADVLAQAASSSNTTVDQLGNALVFAAPAAAAFNISIEETSAVLSTFSNAGIQSTNAGTAFRRVIASIAGPTQNLTRELNRLGIAVDELDFGEDGFVGTLERLQGLDATTLFSAFETRTASALALLLPELSSVRAFTRQNEEAEGTAQALRRIQDDTLAGDFDRLRSAISGLSQALGDDASGPLRSLVQLATNAVTYAGQNPYQVLGLGTGLIASGGLGYLNIDNLFRENLHFQSEIKHFYADKKSSRTKIGELENRGAKFANSRYQAMSGFIPYAMSFDEFLEKDQDFREAKGSNREQHYYNRAQREYNRGQRKSYIAEQQYSTNWAGVRRGLGLMAIQTTVLTAAFAGLGAVIDRVSRGIERQNRLNLVSNDFVARGGQLPRGRLLGKTGLPGTSEFNFNPQTGALYFTDGGAVPKPQNVTHRDVLRVINRPFTPMDLAQAQALADQEGTTIDDIRRVQRERYDENQRTAASIIQATGATLEDPTRPFDVTDNRYKIPRHMENRIAGKPNRWSIESQDYTLRLNNVIAALVNHYEENIFNPEHIARYLSESKTSGTVFDENTRRFGEALSKYGQQYGTVLAENEQRRLGYSPFEIAQDNALREVGLSLSIHNRNKGNAQSVARRLLDSGYSGNKSEILSQIASGQFTGRIGELRPHDFKQFSDILKENVNQELHNSIPFEILDSPEEIVLNLI